MIFKELLSNIKAWSPGKWRLDMSLIPTDGLDVGDRRQPRLRPLASTVIILCSGREHRFFLLHSRVAPPCQSSIQMGSWTLCVYQITEARNSENQLLIYRSLLWRSLIFYNLKKWKLGFPVSALKCVFVFFMLLSLK